MRSSLARFVYRLGILVARYSLAVAAHIEPRAVLGELTLRQAKLRDLWRP